MIQNDPHVVEWLDNNPPNGHDYCHRPDFLLLVDDITGLTVAYMTVREVP